VTQVVYLREGADEGLWTLLAADGQPDITAADEVLVVAGVGWSQYDVEAFRAFAEHLRRSPRRVFAADLDGAGGQDAWQHWAARMFPGVPLDAKAVYQTPWIARYRDGRLDTFESGHKALARLREGAQ
jgi:hypothetical protein